MNLLQFLPKSLKLPDHFTLYNLKNISYEMAKSYLVTLPVTDRTLGIEVVLKEDKKDSIFFIEYHKTDLSLEKVSPLDFIIYPDTQMTCYSLYPSKSSIFPFSFEQTNIFDIPINLLKGEEFAIIQILFIKVTTEKLRDRLWTQYEDYVNGIEHPAKYNPTRAIQQSILELMFKIEGGYKRNPRIPESEQKLGSDFFRTEVRLLIRSEDRDRRGLIAEAISKQFKNTDYANQWLLAEETRKRSFINNIQLRRPNLLSSELLLSPMELANLFVTEKPGDQTVITNPTQEESQQVSETANESVTIEENPLSLFPRGKVRKKEDDVYLAQDLNEALRKLNLIHDEDVVIQKIQHGATVQTITFTLPEGLKLSNLTRAKDDIQTEMALNDIGIEQGKSAGTVSLTIPQEERNLVFVGDCVNNEGFQRFIKEAELPLLVGMDTTGNVIYIDLVKIKHLLIAGTTGSGKSVFLNVLLLLLLTLKTPKELQMFLIDAKKVELNQFSDFPHVQKVCTEMNEAEGLLYYLCEKMDERYEIFSRKGFKNIQQHNRNVNENEKMPYIILVIDELADLILTNPEIEDFVVRLAQKARAAGIHLIIATQRPVKDVVTGLIKANIYSRVCFACDSGISYRIALDEVPKFNLLGRGDGVYRFEGIQGLHRFQGGLIAKTEEETDEIIKKLSIYWKGKASIKKEEIDIESMKQKKIDEELNKFKKVVLESGETRITELQKILNVRTEKIRGWMDELVEIGWVVKHKSRARGYELVLSEEDKKKILNNLI